MSRRRSGLPRPCLLCAVLPRRACLALAITWLKQRSPHRQKMACGHNDPFPLLLDEEHPSDTVTVACYTA